MHILSSESDGKVDTVLMIIWSNLIAFEKNPMDLTAKDIHPKFYKHLRKAAQIKNLGR